MADELDKAATAGDLYGGLLSKLLEIENTKKASIEQRGLAVITTAGGLVTLLVALAALLLGKDPSTLFDWPARAALVAAVLAFIVAAVLGLAANAPRYYGGMTFEDLDHTVSKAAWMSDKSEASYLIARQRVGELKTARMINDKKAGYLQRGIVFEVAGVGLVASAVILAVTL